MLMALSTPPKDTRKLWYEDGNVVLLCGDRSFRVHKSILSNHSSVFRDMFTVPQPAASADATSFIEGCPIVRLPDYPLHLEYLLFALYDRSFFTDRTVDRHFPEIAAGIISLAHKYDVHRLLDEAIFRLSQIYPSTIDEFRRMETEGEPLEILGNRTSLISVINVARQIRPSGLDALLPFTFYLCCQLDVDALVDGVTLQEGRVERLSTEDLKRCMVGKTRLVEVNGEVMGCLVTLGPDACKTADDCSEARIRLQTHVQGLGMFRRCDALSRIDDVLAINPHIRFPLCSECVQDTYDYHAYCRGEIWSRLRKYFDLEVASG